MMSSLYLALPGPSGFLLRLILLGDWEALLCLRVLNINLLAQHIPGRDNTVADHLSRLQVNEFFRLVPAVDLNPTPIPDELCNI